MKQHCVTLQLQLSNSTEQYVVPFTPTVVPLPIIEPESHPFAVDPQDGVLWMEANGEQQNDPAVQVVFQIETLWTFQQQTNTILRWALPR